MRPTAKNINRAIPSLLVVTIVFTSLWMSPTKALSQKSPFEPALAGLNWRSIGPAVMGGRIDAFAAVDSKPGTVYCATASGGVFKTENYGTTWTSLFDFYDTTTTGAVAVSKSNSDTVWIGTGEANGRQSASWGAGAYKSTDAGKTWTDMGLKETSAIGKILIHPTNPDIVYIAAQGNLWKANKERGLYKTTDGGKTWNAVLWINEDTGVTDAVMDPTNPDVIIAATYQRRRTPFGFNGGGPGSGLHKTTDGGAHWTKLSKGLSGKEMGRIGLTIYQKNPKILYSIIEDTPGNIYSTTGTGGVYRSDDQGESWTKQNDLNPRASYYSRLLVDPNNDKNLWVLGVNLHYSTDAGKTFTTRQAQRIHSDFHAFYIDPLNSNHVMAGCDGGIWQSFDNGVSWDHLNTIPLGQFYEIAYDMRKPYRVYGGLQDNYSWGGPSMSPYSEGVTNDDWINIGGGDGFYNMVDPSNDDMVYQESQNGGVTRLNVAVGERKGIQPRQPRGEPAYRFDWNAPMVISPHNPKRIYMGANRLFISDDHGDHWRRTEDLTTQPDRNKMPIMGVIVDPKKHLSPHEGQDTFGQLITITESPAKKGVLYVGTDDGNLQVSKDDGKTWKNVAEKVPGVPKGTYVVRLVASKYADGRCYAAFDGHRSGDFKPYLFVTEDFGETWKPLSNGIPEFATLHVVREHHRNQNLLFAGTERGLYVSFDRGDKWIRMGQPLPSVPIDDIQIHKRENDLILGTHGRSIWILDDITHLEQWAESLDKPAYLFTPRSTVAWRISGKKGYTGHKFFGAPNPNPNAQIRYFLTNTLDEKDPFRLSILSKDGQHIIAELGTFDRDKGLHRANWDMRANAIAYRGPIDQPVPSAYKQNGPRVLPGTYKVRLTAGAATLERDITIEEDPRLRISDRDRSSAFEAGAKVAELQTRSSEIGKALTTSKDELAELSKSDDLKKAPEAVRNEVKRVSAEAEKLDKMLNGSGNQASGQRPGGGRGNRSERESTAPTPAPQPPTATPLPAGSPAKTVEEPKKDAKPVVESITQKLSTVRGVDSITEAPSPETKAQIDSIRKELDGVIKTVNRFNESEMAGLNKLLEQNKLKVIKVGGHVN